MNILIAKSTFAAAKSAAAAGQAFKAAGLFLSAQRQAQQCRAAARREIWDYAHAGASVQSSKVLDASQNHAERSEAGRIRAESLHMYNKGI